MAPRTRVAYATRYGVATNRTSFWFVAHTKSGGSTKLGRDSRSKRLGVKVSNNEPVNAGQVIIRQRGTHYIHGKNVARGADDTLYALKSGVVKFISSKKTCFDGSRRFVKIVTIF